MENQVIEAVTLAGSADNLDFSIWALFLRADPIVKSVIVLLLVASIWCWAIIIDKVIVSGSYPVNNNVFEGLMVSQTYAKPDRLAHTFEVQWFGEVVIVQVRLHVRVLR